MANEIPALWNKLNDEIGDVLRRHKIRHHTLSKLYHEQYVVIFVERDSQKIMAKVAIDFRYATLLEKDKKMIDMLSEDAIIGEVVRQCESYKTLESCLLLMREQERVNATYSRLSN